MGTKQAAIGKFVDMGLGYAANHPERAKTILRKYVIGNFANKAISDMIDYIPKDKRKTFSLALEKDVHNLGDNLVDTVVDIIADPTITDSYKQTMKNFTKKTLMSDKRKAFFEKFGYNPQVYPVITYTKKCTVGCKDCYAGFENAIMNFNQMDLLVSTLVRDYDFGFIVGSGGETNDKFIVPGDNVPMVENMFKLYEKYSDVLFHTYTSGKTFGKEVIKRQAELGNVIFLYSLEGGRERTDARRGKGTYDHLMHLFELSNSYGVPFGISSVPTRENVRELDTKFFKKMKAKGARIFWLFGYAPIDKNPHLDDLLTHKQREWFYWEIKKARKETGMFLASFWEDGIQIQGCMTPLYFHVSCIHENGKTIPVLEPCVFLPNSATRNLEERLRRGEHWWDITNSDLQMQELRKYCNECKKDPASLAEPNCFFRSNIKDYVEIIKKSDAKVSRPYPLPLFSDPKTINGMQTYADEWKEIIRKNIFPLYLENKLPY